jgi:hypothetical protein
LPAAVGESPPVARERKRGLGSAFALRFSSRTSAWPAPLGTLALVVERERSPVRGSATASAAVLPGSEIEVRTHDLEVVGMRVLLSEKLVVAWIELCLVGIFACEDFDRVH